MKRQYKGQSAQRFLNIAHIQKYFAMCITLNNDPSQVISDYHPRLHTVQINGRKVALTSKDSITVDADIHELTRIQREISFMIDELHAYDLSHPDQVKAALAEDF